MKPEKYWQNAFFGDRLNVIHCFICIFFLLCLEYLLWSWLILVHSQIRLLICYSFVISSFIWSPSFRFSVLKKKCCLHEHTYALCYMCMWENQVVLRHICKFICWQSNVSFFFFGKMGLLLLWTKLSSVMHFLTQKPAKHCTKIIIPF